MVFYSADLTWFADPPFCIRFGIQDTRGTTADAADFRRAYE